jgi:hypothetical protein
MGIFDKKRMWRYEIAPMYMELEAKPMTAKSQTFFVLCGLTSSEVFSGNQFPQVGELIYLPGFRSKHQVSSIRVMRIGNREADSKKYPATVYFDPATIQDEDYWCVKPGKMRTISEWGWSTNHYPSSYKAFGYEPSDWKDKKLKFKERDYVLGWTKFGYEFMAQDGEVYSRLDPKHSYLEEWFPEVKNHLERLKWSS